MSEHTKGPWVVTGHLEASITDPSGQDVAWVSRRQGYPFKANARLIAAAPTLVRELEDAADMLHEIALECAHCNYSHGATGKSSDGESACEECAPTREAERRARAAIAKAEDRQS